MKFNLIEDGRVINTIKINELSNISLRGEVYQAVSWDMEDNVCEENFFANIYIKWDGCSHIYFEGEDKIDSYYHLCGGNYFIEHMQTLAFIVKVAKDNIEKYDDEIGRFSIIEKMNLLEDCRIEKVEDK